MTSKNDSEIQNKFSVLGENLSNQKTSAEVCNTFSKDVFDNFDLSPLKEEN